MKYLLFTLVGVVSFLSGYVHAQGLRFFGNESRIADRSSWCVFDDANALPAARQLSVTFEYNVQNYLSPGYIFYLKDTKSDRAYNLTYVYDAVGNTGSFMFAQDGKRIFHTVTLPIPSIHRRRIPVSLRMDFEAGKATLCVAGDSASVNIAGAEDRGELAPQLYFGTYRHIMETASFCLYDLHVECDGRQWDFPLDESQGKDVHDSRGTVVGQVQNPVWLINDAFHWKPIYRYYSLSPAGFALSASRQLAFIYNRDSLITYDLRHGDSQGRSYDSPALPVRLGMCFYDEPDSCIYAYELNGWDTYMARINPASCRWQMLDKGSVDLQLHHHGALFDQQSRRFLFFGGYGNRSYFNAFIRYDLGTNRWDTLTFDGDAVAPRFFAAMTMTPDGKHAYLYGGKGNEAGDQNVGIRYYYDLYRLDLEKCLIEKLWEHDAPAESRVPARDMVISPDGQWLYLLAYPEWKPQTHLRLYRVSVADGTYEALGDSIPMASEEIATNANLYYNARLHEFYCVIQEFGKYGDNETRIYALSAPPVGEEAVHRYDAASGASWPAGWLWVGVAACLACTGLVWHRRRRMKKVGRRESGGGTVLQPQAVALPQEPAQATVCPVEPSESAVAVQPVVDSPVVDEVRELAMPTAALPMCNLLLLFGPFCAIDRQGRDMSHLFSPKIRHLFLYILINSVLKNGVLSSDLNALFWPDKPEEKIKNLKNVHINHLRKVLQDMDGIVLTHNQGYYRLEWTEEWYCDFRRLALLSGNLTQMPEREEERNEIIHLLARGRFMDTVREDVFDYVKQRVETYAISFLEQQIEAVPFTGRLRICRILSAWDSLSEVAMCQAVCTYCQLNLYDKALQVYTAFVGEYRRLMGEDYPRGFKDITGDK